MQSLPPNADPLDVLIVASWYPGYDDTARGRFVADQAEALAGTGMVRPLVASFDPTLADRDFLARPHYLRSVADFRARALSSRGDAVNARAWGSEQGIGVARVPVTEGSGNAASADVQGDLRRDALVELVDRIAVGQRGVVHAHTAYPDGYAAAAVAERLGWPLVITEHATFVARQLGRRAQRDRYLEAVRAASRFIAVSDALAEELRVAIPGLDEKLVVVPNAVAIDDFTPTGLEGRRREELLFVGYRRERKGVVTLLRAFADVLEERPNATLRLLGKSLTDAEEHRWQELAEDLEVTHAVSFEPPADRSGIVAAMARASLLVHASHRETFGITTIEALASGLPVVAARAGGISTILEDRALGELVPPQDARFLALAILRTLARRSEFDPAYLRAATEPFAAPAVAGRLLSLYGEVLTADAPQRTDRPAGTLPWVGRTEAIAPPVVLFALNSARAGQQLNQLPPELLAELAVVTAGPESALPSGLRMVVSAEREVERQLRAIGLFGPRGRATTRLRRLLRDPLGPVRRRLMDGGLYELRQGAVAAAVLAATERSGILEPSTSSIERAPEVICLEAVDYLASAGLVASGRLRPAPGGILWLADRWRSLHPAPGERPSRSSTRDAIQSPSTGQ